jgi:MtN3 and saliva related transmembrane protein
MPMSPALIEGIGSLAAIITTLCWVPQAIRVIRTRETRAISLVAQVSLLVGIALWLVYGVLLGSQPLIWANIVTFVLVGTIVVLKLRYG